MPNDGKDPAEQSTILLGQAQAAATADGATYPASIGLYRILRLLGEGGMGRVYEAEQNQPRRLVALKVIKSGWASPETLRRFDAESQALARLHHPGIAQIYEAGSADAGYGVQPFFAMELIHGKPLVGYANEKKLSTRQRLELMIRCVTRCTTRTSAGSFTAISSLATSSLTRPASRRSSTLAWRAQQTPTLRPRDRPTSASFSARSPT